MDILDLLEGLHTGETLRGVRTAAAVLLASVLFFTGSPNRENRNDKKGCILSD